MSIARALVRPPQVRSAEDREAIARNAAIAGLRIEIEPEPEPVIEVWPDHWQPYEVADSMTTQLNIGMAGVIGWRYEALPMVFRAVGVTLAQQREMWGDLRVIEKAVVAAMREATK